MRQYTIISNNSLIFLIESNGTTQTTYYTNTRELLTTISVLNLLSLDGTSYLDLSKVISTKDSISLDIEFYKENSTTDKKVYTLTTQFNTQ